MSVIGFHIKLNFRVFQHLLELTKAKAWYKGDQAHARTAEHLLTNSIEKEYKEWQEKQQKQNQEGTI